MDSQAEGREFETRISLHFRQPLSRLAFSMLPGASRGPAGPTLLRSGLQVTPRISSIEDGAVNVKNLETGDQKAFELSDISGILGFIA